MKRPVSSTRRSRVLLQERDTPPASLLPQQETPGTVPGRDDTETIKLPRIREKLGSVQVRVVPVNASLEMRTIRASSLAKGMKQQPSLFLFPSNRPNEVSDARFVFGWRTKFFRNMVLLLSLVIIASSVLLYSYATIHHQSRPLPLPNAWIIALRSIARLTACRTFASASSTAARISSSEN